MERPSDVGHLKSGEWDLIQELADRFENACRTEGKADIAAFLPALNNPLRPVALLELIKSDLEISWRSGEGRRLEDYLQRFPEVGTPATVPARLLYEEYRVRHVHGDRPSVEEYRSRFPSQYSTMRQLLIDDPLPTIGGAAPTPSPTPAPSPAASQPMEAAPVMTISGGNVLAGGASGFKLIRRIGTGGFGEVWLAEAPGGVPVAIKIIYRPVDHDEAKRELRSLELIKQLRHHFLLQTQQFWTHEDRLYIVMELAEGNLRDRHKECRVQGLPAIPLAELLRYFRESAEAIDYVHSEHVLHRDIKPDNILLLKGHAKVADFGLARAQLQANVSVSGSGTPAYMAPEVWRGKASELSDLYAFALTYVEMRLGRRAFPGNDYMSVMIDHLEKPPDLTPLVGAERDVLLKALAKKPGDRYPNCVAFAEALQEALADELKTIAGRPSGSHQGTQLKDQGAMQTDRDPGAGPGSPFNTLGARLLTEAASGIEDTDLPRTPLVPGTGSPSSKRRLVLSVAGICALLLFACVGYVAYSLMPIPTTKPTGPETNNGRDRDGGPPVTNGSNRDKDPETIRPPQVAGILLFGWEKAPGAVVVQVDGRAFYTRIMVSRPGVRIPFILVPHKEPDDPPTFYIMENKVSNEQFAKFVEANPLQKPSDWQMGGRKDTQDMTAEPALPVLRVRAGEAQAFAEWLGGKLPTMKQWDRTAGYSPQSSPNDGPYQKDAVGEGPAFGVNRVKDGPLPVGKATRDKSALGVRDMAGNGREFTRNLVKGNTLPLPGEPKGELVILRGKSYTSTKPLSFADLKYEQTTPHTQYNHVASPYTGFRVVLEVE